MISISKGSKPSRAIVIVIDSPFSPRIKSTASVRVKPNTGVSSIWIIKSPAKTPALYAGVSSMGEITLTKPSSIVISIPNPPNFPRVSIVISSHTSSFIYPECGSRPVSMPSIAFSINSSSVTSSTY